MKLRKLLNISASLFGTSSRITLFISRRADSVMVREQLKMMEGKLNES